MSDISTLQTSCTIFPDVASTFGKTPLIGLRRFGQGLPGRIVVKLESRNPCGSIKDRIGVAMVEDAERRGYLRPGGTLIEATTGNTGIAVAFVAAARGYRLLLTMPEEMSNERAALLSYLGAEVVLTPGSSIANAVTRAERLHKEVSGSVLLRQFENPANPDVHRRTTALEIWQDTIGAIDVFVAGVGTGGTITGVGEVLKARKPAVRIVAVEPDSCAVLSGRPAGHHGIQGLGAGFLPRVLNLDVIDEVATVTEEEAFAAARRLAREEGIAAGISSGANLAAALRIASRPDMSGRLIVTIVCDTGERYVNTPLMTPLMDRVARSSR